MKTIILIPARGGSRGVPRKNVLLLNNKPLIQYVIETTKDLPDIDIYVMTDDDEIAYISESLGVKVVREEKTTGKATLDEVTVRFLDSISNSIEENDLLLTIQPTCPFVKRETILKAITHLNKTGGSVLTVLDDRHLCWGINEDGEPKKLYNERVNRQVLPPQFKESGAIIGSTIKNIRKYNTRIVEPINLIEVEKEEGIDIDDFFDWSMAEYVAKKKEIVIRTDASSSLGMGHVYRSLALAQELAGHNITIFVESELAFNFLNQFPFKTKKASEQNFLNELETSKPDICFIDLLDTTVDFMKSVQSHCKKLVTLEDLGEGAKLSDLLISDLYRNEKIPDEKQLSGMENSILAPAFDILSPKSSHPSEINKILVLFGGTDPSSLTEKTLKALEKLKFQGEVTAIIGRGKENQAIEADDYELNLKIEKDVNYMPKYMLDCEIAISSAGRTITELTSLGIPTLCMCQNEKELLHTHASQQFGVLNLGLGSLLPLDVVADQVKNFLNNDQLRQTMFERINSRKEKRKNKTIINRIMSRLYPGEY